MELRINPRLQQLADQCTNQYRDGNGGYIDQIDIEKFAELIVKSAMADLEKLRAEYAIELTVKYPELYFPTFTEKFSELIVQECAETIQDFVVHRFPASEYPGRLKNYFGVK